MFSTRGFLVSDFCVWSKTGVQFHYFTFGCLVFPIPLLKKLSFLHHIFLGPLSQINLAHTCGLISDFSVLNLHVTTISAAHYFESGVRNAEKLGWWQMRAVRGCSHVCVCFPKIIVMSLWDRWFPWWDWLWSWLPLSPFGSFHFLSLILPPPWWLCELPNIFFVIYFMLISVGVNFYCLLLRPLTIQTKCL